MRILAEYMKADCAFGMTMRTGEIGGFTMDESSSGSVYQHKVGIVCAAKRKIRAAIYSFLWPGASFRAFFSPRGSLPIRDEIARPISEVKYGASPSLFVVRRWR